MTVIIIILLIILVIWAFGITFLYAELLRGVKQIITANTDAVLPLFDMNSLLIQIVREAVDATESVKNLVMDYRKAIDEELEKNAKEKKFALETIQEARRIYNSVNANIAPEVIEEEGGNEDDRKG